MHNVAIAWGTPEKKPYQTPTLVCFGSLADLTAAGSGGPTEHTDGICWAPGQIAKGGVSSRACR